MSKFVVRQPIKDSNQNIFGYEILFSRETDSLYNNSNEYAAAETISSFLMQNNEKIFNDKITFMTFTPNLLFKNTPKIFKQKNLIIQIEDNVIVHPLAMGLIQRFRKEGYNIAISDFQFAPRYFGLMEYIDYIKINFLSLSADSAENIINLSKGFGKKCIATGVDTKEKYDIALNLGVDYVQGIYVAQPMTTKVSRTEYLQSNFFQLLIAVTKDEPNMEEIAEIISRDATLTYAILKMVNSVYFALRHRTSSVRQALVVLGIAQLKQWVYLLSFKQDGSGSSEELLKLSFLRAIFCQELTGRIKNIGISKSEGYLMGMFSTIGNLIDAPLEDIFSEIPVIDEIKKALISHEGICGTLYDLILSYEKADWKNIEKLAAILGIQSDIIASIYFDCVEEVNNIWNNLTKGMDNKKESSEEDQTLEKLAEELEQGSIEQYDTPQFESQEETEAYHEAINSEIEDIDAQIRELQKETELDQEYNKDEDLEQILKENIQSEQGNFNIDEILPVVEASKTGETVSFVEASKTDETVPVVEASKTSETVPVVEETKTDEIAPVAEEAKTDETAPVAEETKTDEIAPVAEEAKTDETVSVAEEVKTDETVSVAEEAKTDETAPVAEEAKTDEIAKSETGSKLIRDMFKTQQKRRRK